MAVVFQCMLDPELRAEACQVVLGTRAVRHLVGILRGSAHSGGRSQGVGSAASVPSAGGSSHNFLSYDESIPLLELLSTREEAVVAIHHAGAAAPLVSVLASARSSEAVQAAVAGIIRRLARVPGAAPRLIAEGAIRHLLAMLCGAPERLVGTRQQAALALSVLVERGEGWKERAWAEAAGSHQVPEALSKLLMAPDTSVRYAAAEAMHSILQSHDQWLQVDPPARCRVHHCRRPFHSPCRPCPCPRAHLHVRHKISAAPR